MNARTRLSTLLIGFAACTAACAADGAATPMPGTPAEYQAYKASQDAASNEAYRKGDTARVRAIEQATLEAARRFGDREEETRSIHGLAVAALAAGDLPAAEIDFRKAISLAGSIDNQRGVAASLRGLGRVLESHGRLPEATEVQVTALELLLKHGEPLDQSESYYSLAKLFLNQKNHRAAKHGVDRAIALMGDSPPDFPLGLNLALRSTIERELGNPAAAVKDGEAALAAFARQDSRIGEGIAKMALGRALASGGQTERGLALLEEGLAAATEVKEVVLRGDILLGQGVVLNGMQRHQQALAPLLEAATISDELSLENLRRDVQLELQTAYSALGRTEDALAASKQAFEAQTKIASLAMVGQMAGRSAESQLAALNSRFLSLDPATRATQPVLAKPAGDAGMNSWWLLAIAALAIGLAAALRHGRRLRMRQRDLESAHARLQDQSEHLRQQISLDPLTGALTRRAFAEDLAAVLQLARSRQGTVSLIVFDLDHFKAINDRHGHMTGDAALKLLVGLVREQLDSEDLFGRFGGDEFLLAVRHPPLEAVAIAERIRASVDQRTRAVGSQLPPLGISMGVAHAGPATGYDPDTLFLRADAALYAAKDAGRNRIVVDDGDLPPPGDPRSLLHPGTLDAHGHR